MDAPGDFVGVLAYCLGPMVGFCDSVLAVVWDDTAEVGGCDADDGVHEKWCLNEYIRGPVGIYTHV